MLEIGINDLSKNFGFKNVLDGVSFEVMSGERVALVGRNRKDHHIEDHSAKGEGRPGTGLHPPGRYGGLSGANTTDF